MIKKKCYLISSLMLEHVYHYSSLKKVKKEIVEKTLAEKN